MEDDRERVYAHGAMRGPPVNPNSFGQAMRETLVAQRSLARAMGVAVEDIRTVAGARAAYMRGRITVEEFEERLEGILREGEPSWCDLQGHTPMVNLGEARVFCAICGADTE